MYIHGFVQNLIQLLSISADSEMSHEFMIHPYECIFHDMCDIICCRFVAMATTTTTKLTHAIMQNSSK